MRHGVGASRKTHRVLRIREHGLDPVEALDIVLPGRSYRISPTAFVRAEGRALALSAGQEELGANCVAASRAATRVCNER